MISNIYKELSCQFDNVFILGCAPCLNQEYPTEATNNDLIIGLNSSFLKFSMNLHFYCCPRFFSNYPEQLKESTITTIVSNNLKTKPDQYTYKPSLQVGKDKTSNSLFRGYSVLVPALHFSLLLNAHRVVLCGFDLRKDNHFYDPEDIKKKFPSRTNIIRQIKELLSHFPDKQVRCKNKLSLLVTKRAVTPL